MTCAEKIRLPFFSYIDVDCLPGKGEGRGGGVSGLEGLIEDHFVCKYMYLRTKKATT